MASLILLQNCNNYYYLCDMVFITSLSPSHINKGVQQKAVNSWVEIGGEVVSFNHPDEIGVLKAYKNVTFIPTTQTMEHIFGKPYVRINAMMDWAKIQSQKHICLINSDIELENNKILLHKIRFQLHDKVVICHRSDYEKKKEEGKPYVLGIDAFFLNQKHLDIYPPSLFCMGNCHWDYNMPFTAIKNGIEVINLQNKFAFHKAHNVQYSPKNWETTGKMFAMEHRVDSDNVGRLTELIFNFLNLNMKKVTL